MRGLRNNKLVVLTNNNRIYKYIIIAIYILFAVWGIIVYRDYGVSWDEIIERGHSLSLWQLLYDKFTDGNNVPTIVSEFYDSRTFSQYYGVAIRYPIMLIEYLAGFSLSNEQIYYQAHLYTFVLFF